MTTVSTCGRAGQRARSEHATFKVGPVSFGLDHLVVIAGPGTVESGEQIRTAAKVVKRLGAHMLRAGVFHPRASPYEFQGLGEPALRLVRDAGDETGIPVVIEVTDPRDVALTLEYADMLEIRAQDMHSVPLLKEVGMVRKPVLLERGPAATVEEWLLAAEYILESGNPQVVLCERGIRTFDTCGGNTLDLAAVALVKEMSHLPVVVYPCYGRDVSSLVPAMARAAVAAGADGLVVQMHPDPGRALVDGSRSLGPLDFAALMYDVRNLAAVLGKRLSS